jgi:DNA-directed RNA polymerase specialized sigma24 family protein
MAKDDARTEFTSFSTDWQQVRQASDPSSEQGREALAQLIARYRPGLTAYLTAQFRFDSEEVQDVFQSFIEQKILREGLLARADERRGRFRTFLLSAVHNFALSHLRRRRSAKRSPSQPLLNLEDVPQTELPASSDPSSEEAEAMWAQAVIAGALLDMYHELQSSGRLEIWEVFAGRVLRPLLNDEPPLGYTELIDQFEFASPTQALNVLVTAKRMFRRHLRNVVVRYVGEGPAVDAELEQLRWILEK